MQPLRIALLTSRGAPGVARLLEDPNRGTIWDLSIVAESQTPLADLLEDAAPDYILVCGYESIIPDAIVARFEGKILAVHDDASDEILFGENATRCSVSMLMPGPARNPLFLLGAPYPVAPMALDARERGDADFLAAYAALHRQWMISTAWGELLARTLELLAGGTMHIIGDTVWIDGAPGPCRMGHAPDVCHDPETMVARGIPRSCPFIG